MIIFTQFAGRLLPKYFYIKHWFSIIFFDGSVVCEKRAIIHDKKIVDDNWWTQCG